MDLVERHRRARDDRGVGLPELLVSMAVFSIVVAAVGAVFVNTIDSVRFASTKTATTADARIAMEAMTRSIRVAVIPTGEDAAILTAEDGRLDFYASLDRGPGQTSARPTRVTYSYNSATRCLEERQVLATDRVPPNPARPFVWSGAGTTKCLIETNAAPRFAYFADGRIIDDDVTPAVPVPKLATPAGVLPAGDLDEVVSVQMEIDVLNPGATDINGTLAVDRVALANVQYANSSGG